MRLVIENLPESVFTVLRRLADAAGSTPENVAQEILVREVVRPNAGKFDDLCGMLDQDAELDRIIAEQRKPDRKLWP